MTAQLNVVLTLSCPDRIGIVADVSRFLLEHGCNIVDSAQFGDQETGAFYMRTSFQGGGALSVEALERDFRTVAARHGMTFQMSDMARRMSTILMVSRFGHCLNDLLFRWKIGALPVDIRAVVSNHTDFEAEVKAAGLPFIHLPVTKETKAQQEAKLAELVDAEGADLIVLARYMQVLSQDLCARYPGKIINIHHSFLPSFVGARPYQRAHERGVKLIGATAHYVTSDLDEGPIIEQGVERVHHGLSAEDFVDVGRDIEAQVLARAVKWHAEHRVLINGNKTVVFS
jgi:formyltetrahydrofolate deformylase